MYKVHYQSCDGYSETRSFKTIDGARKRAQHWVGKNPDCTHSYAVSGDGVGTVRFEGATCKEVFNPEVMA